MTENQQKLFNLIGHIPQWKHLTELPDEICKTLYHMALSLRGGGFLPIEAKVKIDRLSQMSKDEVISAYLLSNMYTYQKIDHLKTATDLKRFLQPGMFLEQTRFTPKHEFNHLKVVQVSRSNRIVFLRLHDGKESELPWSPASQFRFEADRIVVHHQGTDLFHLKPIYRQVENDVDWYSLLDKTRQIQINQGEQQ
jgi:hypothetical protein